MISSRTQTGLIPVSAQSQVRPNKEKLVNATEIFPNKIKLLDNLFIPLYVGNGTQASKRVPPNATDYILKHYIILW